MISTAELKRRKRNLCTAVGESGLDGLLLMDCTNIVYACAYYHVTTERPVCYYVNGDGRSLLFVPALEADEAARLRTVDRFETYFEYPGKRNVMDWILDEICAAFPQAKRVGLDKDSHTLLCRMRERFGHAELCNAAAKLRLIKSEEEIEYMRQAAYFNDFMVGYGFERLRPGIVELELLAEMQTATMKKMIEELDEVVFSGGVASGLIPSGPRTGLPHALPSARRVQAGDVMMLSLGTSVCGYISECERTCFVGEPTERHREAFEVMRSAQEYATSLMVPGASCSEIDHKVLEYIRKKGYGEYIRHRTGHGKGLQKHEPPWVDEGDPTVLQPGMVLSSEPALYIEGFAGFRHSDTIVVGEMEPIILTQFPRDIESLTKHL